MCFFERQVYRKRERQGVSHPLSALCLSGAFSLLLWVLGSLPSGTLEQSPLEGAFPLQLSDPACPQSRWAWPWSPDRCTQHAPLPFSQIEKFFPHILEKEQSRPEGQPSSLSLEELVFAKE